MRRGRDPEEVEKKVFIRSSFTCRVRSLSSLYRNQRTSSPEMKRKWRVQVFGGKHEISSRSCRSRFVGSSESWNLGPMGGRGFGVWDRAFRYHFSASSKSREAEERRRTQLIFYVRKMGVSEEVVDLLKITYVYLNLYPRRSLTIQSDAMNLQYDGCGSLTILLREKRILRTLFFHRILGSPCLDLSRTTIRDEEVEYDPSALKKTAICLLM